MRERKRDYSYTQNSLHLTCIIFFTTLSSHSLPRINVFLCTCANGHQITQGHCIVRTLISFFRNILVFCFDCNIAPQERTIVDSHLACRGSFLTSAQIYTKSSVCFLFSACVDNFFSSISSNLIRKRGGRIRVIQTSVVIPSCFFPRFAYAYF